MHPTTQPVRLHPGRLPRRLPQAAAARHGPGACCARLSPVAQAAHQRAHLPVLVLHVLQQLDPEVGQACGRRAWGGARGRVRGGRPPSEWLQVQRLQRGPAVPQRSVQARRAPASGASGGAPRPLPFPLQACIAGKRQPGTHPCPNGSQSPRRPRAPGGTAPACLRGCEEEVPRRAGWVGGRGSMAATATAPAAQGAQFAAVTLGPAAGMQQQRGCLARPPLLPLTCSGSGAHHAGASSHPTRLRQW